MPPNAPKHFFTTLTSLKHSFTPQPPSNTLLRPQLPWNTFWRPNHTQTLLYAPDRSQAPNALGYAQPITGHSSTGGGNTLLYGQFGEHLDDLTNAIYWLTDHWVKNPPYSIEVHGNKYPKGHIHTYIYTRGTTERWLSAGSTDICLSGLKKTLYS